MRKGTTKHEHIVGFDKINIPYENGVKIVYINDYIDGLKTEPPQIVQNFCSVCKQKVNIKRIITLCEKNRLELNRRRSERLSGGKNYWQMPDGRRLPTSEYDDEKAKCTECTFQISVPEEPDNSSCSEIPNNSGLKECGCRYHNEDCKGEVKENGVCADCPPNCFTEKKDVLGTDLEYEVARTVVRIENDLAYLKDQVDMQPKSPCEHDQLIHHSVPCNGLSTSVVVHIFDLWTCANPDCGLVTCKNPFGSDNGQNPNE